MNFSKKHLIVSLLLLSFLMISGSELFHHHDKSESSSEKHCTICLIHSNNCGECQTIEIKIHDRDFDEFLFSDNDSGIQFNFNSSVSDRAPPAI